MLSDKEKSRIKTQIVDQIAQAENSIEKLLEQVKPVAPDRAIGRITRMDAIQQKSVAEARLRDAQEALNNLNNALKNLDNPDFGICVLCKQPIALERILAIPQVTKCVGCA